MKTALVIGVSGPEGAYLAKLLFEKGYQVWGTSRDAQVSSFKNVERLCVRKEVQRASVAFNDFRSVIQVLFKAQPDEVYNLGGQSSVSYKLAVRTEIHRAFRQRSTASATA
jgi:GDPmannose 4,6-dehydratase